MSYLLQNIQAQDNILRALAESNASFTSDKQKILNATQARNAFIENLIFSYESVNDLIEKARKGIAYFETLNEPMRKLYDEVREFCSKSKQERENKLKLMQRVATLQQDTHNAPVNNYRPKPMPSAAHVISPKIDDFDYSSLMNNGGQHQPPPPLNASDITQMMSTMQMGLGGERPKLKDFLPFMKPKSPAAGAGASRRSGGGGPPQLDRNLANFANTSSINQNNFPIQYNQMTNVQPQQQQQQQHQQYNHQYQINSNGPQAPLPNLPQFHQQIPSNQAAFVQGNVNVNVPKQNNLPYSPLSTGQSENSSQNILNQQQQQQQQFQQQQQRLAEEQRMKREFELNQQKLLEQQIREKELQLKKQQLEQQEQQLRLQQQQIQLQQQQQMMLLQQQQSQQQNWVNIFFKRDILWFNLF